MPVPAEKAHIRWEHTNTHLGFPAYKELVLCPSIGYICASAQTGSPLSPYQHLAHLHLPDYLLTPIGGACGACGAYQHNIISNIYLYI